MRLRRTLTRSVARAFAALVLTTACGPKSLGSAKPAAPVAPLVEVAEYDVRVAEDARSLCVDARVPPRAGRPLVFEDGGERFVTGLSTTDGGARYCFDLARAAKELDDASSVEAHGSAFLAAPSAWLAHPSDPPDDARFRLRVAAPAGVRFVSGFPADASGALHADLGDLLRAPYAAIGRFDVRSFARPFPVEVAFLEGSWSCGAPSIFDWIASSARVVSSYYGGAPIPKTLVIVAPEDGANIGYARTMGNGGASILAPIGTSMAASDLGASWPMVHEMLHVAFPNLPKEQRWLEEGMATYVEPIARARAGLIGEREAFERFARRMPLGEPAEGDLGLDRTPTWGRTYWGGAIFCMLADVEIRARTKNARSLDDALVAMLREGGSVATRWDMDDVVACSARATQTNVLGELYERYGKRPERFDVAALFARLGVRVAPDGVVTLDDAAPLADVRRAIFAKR